MSRPIVYINDKRQSYNNFELRLVQDYTRRADYDIIYSQCTYIVAATFDHYHTIYCFYAVVGESQKSGRQEIRLITSRNAPKISFEIHDGVTKCLIKHV